MAGVTLVTQQNQRSKSFRAISEQRKTEERDGSSKY